MSTCDDDLKIGYTASGVLTLRQLNINAPDQVVFRPAAVYYPRSDFSRVGDGFASAEWIWDIVSIANLSRLLSFLQGEDWANVYMGMDKRDGLYPTPQTAWALFSAKMWKPMLGGDEGNYVAKSPYSVQTVSVKFINMIEIFGYYL